MFWSIFVPINWICVILFYLHPSNFYPSTRIYCCKKHGMFWQKHLLNTIFLYRYTYHYTGVCNSYLWRKSRAFSTFGTIEKACHDDFIKLFMSKLPKEKVTFVVAKGDQIWNYCVAIVALAPIASTLSILP